MNPVVIYKKVEYNHMKIAKTEKRPVLICKKE